MHGSGGQNLVGYSLQMSYKIFSHDVAQSIFELHGLNEEVVLRDTPRGAVRGFEVEAEPLLHAEVRQRRRPRRQIHVQAEIERQRSSEDGVAAEEVDLKLHGIAKPAENVDIIPTLLVIPAGRIVVNPDFVKDVLIKIGVLFGLKDVFEDAELGLFLGFERLRIVEYFTVAIAKDVRRVPAGKAEVTGLEGWREDRLDKGLAGLEVFAADWRARQLRELAESGDVYRQIRCAIGEGDPLFEARPCVKHRRGDAGVVVDEALLKGSERLVNGGLFQEDLGRAAPEHDLAVGPG